MDYYIEQKLIGILPNNNISYWKTSLKYLQPK